MVTKGLVLTLQGLAQQLAHSRHSRPGQGPLQVLLCSAARAPHPPLQQELPHSQPYWVTLPPDSQAVREVL